MPERTGNPERKLRQQTGVTMRGPALVSYREDDDFESAHDLTESLPATMTGTRDVAISEGDDTSCPDAMAEADSPVRMLAGVLRQAIASRAI